MKKRKISITAKILITAGSILIGILFLFNFLGFFVFTGTEGQSNIYLIIGTLSIAVLIAVFIIVIYFIVIKRILELNQAVQKVAQGDYTVTVSSRGNDELSTLADNFNKMAKELQLNAMLSKDFVSYVSHELKTPLSVIRTHAEALYDSTDEERRAYTDVIIGETDWLTGLSKNIIMLCRLDSTNMISKDDEFSPSEQIKSFVLSTQMQWDAKKLNVELDVEDCEIKGNAGLTYLIWQNLIGNAFKFTNEGGNVNISLHKSQNELSFSVIDDGIGISEGDKEKLFSLFFTGNKSRNREGSGIGLYLTKNIVQKLGGKISVTSEINKGSCFTVILPL
ncbi:MAG: HAMP domain-containing histidine kinase [Clostridiales bacterium]|nr:HAMP domain-containing histidine kinase [Clostridiales bacterium]